MLLPLSLLADHLSTGSVEDNAAAVSITTVFAAATIYFIARVCMVFIRERRLLISVASSKAIRRETVT